MFVHVLVEVSSGAVFMVRFGGLGEQERKSGFERKGSQAKLDQSSDR